MIEIAIQNTETLYPNEFNELDEVVVRLYGRTDEGVAKSITVTGFEPYFYIPADEQDNLAPADHDELVRYEGSDFMPLRERFSDDPTELVKVVASHPGAVRDLRDRWEKTWGADVVFTNRLRIDKELVTGASAPSSVCSVDEVEPVEMDVEPRVLTLDIETDDRGSGFPAPGGARILSVAVHDSYDDEYVTFLDTDGVEDAEFFGVEDPESMADLGVTEPDALNTFMSEREMLMKFAQWVQQKDPDIITGWNCGDSRTDGFDLPHIVARMENKHVSTSRLSREGYVKNKRKGDDGYRTSIRGRTTLDLMDTWVSTKFTKPDSKRLDDVAQDKLEDAKIEHTDKGFYELYRDNPAKFVDYNTKDTRLTVEINREENVLGFKKRLKDMIGVDWEQTRMNKDFVSMSVRRACHDHEVVMVTAYDNPHVIEAMEGNSDVNYDGAFVFPAFKGVKKNVVGKDLASLYPMTQAMLNASPDTLIDRKRAVKEDIPHVVAENGVTFRTDKDSIIKELVEEYDELKMEYKRELKELEYGTEKYEQMSENYGTTKTIFNSYYGYTGYDKSPLYNPKIAAAVTLTGQVVIKETARYVDEETEGSVAYGDSVPHFEPVYVREDGEVNILPIEQLHNEYDSGEFEVWSEDGWVTCTDTIRKPNRKQMYRVRTRNGVVHVTEDHGLLNESGNEIPPTEVEEGDTLMHTKLADAVGNTSEISHEKAWMYGVLVADGTAIDSQFKVTKNNRSVLTQIGYAMERVFGFDTEVKDYKESSGCLQLRSGDNEWGAVSKLCSKLQPKLYASDGKKKVPEDVLNGTKSVMRAFLDGYQFGDGDDDERYDKLFHRSYTNSHTLGAGLTYLLDRLGMDAGVNFRDNYGKEYPRIHSREDDGIRSEVLSVEQVEYDGDYVYDLSTENEHFNAGIGRLTVHNTDSNYVEYPEEWEQERVLEYAQGVCDDLNEEVYPALCSEFNIPEEDNRWFIELEMLATMFQSGSKKFYAYKSQWAEGMDFDEQVNGGEGKISISGYACVKSNFAPITKDTQREILHTILRDGSKQDVSDIMHEAASSIDARNPDWDRIGMPQGLGQKISKQKSEKENYYTWSTSGDHPQGAHPRGAWFANHLLDVDIGEGDQPSRVYLKPNLTVNGELVDVITFNDGSDLEPIEDELRMDAGKMQRKVLVNPMDDILDAFGVETQAALRGQVETQATLGGFC